MSVVWIDGHLIEAEEAKVSPFDHALLTGDGVFETMRVYRGRPFALHRHLDRLARSAAGLRLPLPDAEVLHAAVDYTLHANDCTEGRVRLTVTGGVAPLGSERGTTGPTVIVACSALSPWPPTADVVVCPWPRNERSAVAGLKTVSYAENVVALAWAKERGAGEALFANLAGHLCEGTGTNVFVVLGGRLVTPPLSSGCLAGVTRDVVLELGLDAIEEDVPLAALADVDEAFLTSSTREVQPIRAIDGRVLRGGAPGPRTAAAAAAFTALVAHDLDP
jgi:branched-chain amino acid aminotransferase